MFIFTDKWILRCNPSVYYQKRKNIYTLFFLQIMFIFTDKWILRCNLSVYYQKRKNIYTLNLLMEIKQMFKKHFLKLLTKKQLIFFSIQNMCLLTFSNLISRMAIFLTILSSSLSKNFLMATILPLSLFLHFITIP